MSIQPRHPDTTTESLHENRDAPTEAPAQFQSSDDARLPNLFDRENQFVGLQSPAWRSDRDGGGT